jgi:hypothetical protein
LPVGDNGSPGSVVVEQGAVQVHTRAGCLLERLRHEGGVHAELVSDLLDREPEGRHGVGHRQGVGVAEVHLVLGRPHLVVGCLDGDPHLLDVLDRPPAEVAAHVERGQVEVGAVVERARLLPLAGLGEEEELDFRADLEAVAQIRRLAEHTPQHVARVGRVGRAVGQPHVAEHARDHGVRPPGKHLEARRVGMGDGIALAQAGTALERRARRAKPLPRAPPRALRPGSRSS